MTALAYNPSHSTSGNNALDFFDDEHDLVPSRPQLRLIHGDGNLSGLQTRPLAMSVEMQRRRRFLALLAATVLVLGIAWGAGVSVTSFGGVATPAATESTPSVHVVLPGDSYAAIAADLGVTNAVAAGEQLRLANGGGELAIGERLVVDVARLNAATLDLAG